jgi:SAM-dependent methyltransferase
VAPDLAASFQDVADAYERGRPRFGPEAVAAVAHAAGGLGGLRVLDVGAGTGRLAGPLLEAGLDVVAVEPLAAMRAVLARTIGARRALPGRAEALPLDDASVDGAVCSDAWHWFDGARAADELARVVRPGGGVVIVVLQVHWYDEPDEAPAWLRETSAVLDPLWKAADHPYLTGSRRPDGLEGHPAFAPFEVRPVPFLHHTDREGMLAHYASISYVASLPSPRRDATLGALAQVLERHGVDAVAMPYRAELWITRRLPAPARPAGRPAAPS